MKLSSSLLIASLAAASGVDAQRNPCQACLQGTPDATLSLGEAACDEWALDVAALAEGSKSCYLQRTLGAQYCGCEVPDLAETCDLCPGGETPPNLDLALPDSNITCGDIAAGMPAVDGAFSCAVIQSYSEYCGCTPPETPPCTVCHASVADADSSNQTATIAMMEHPERVFLAADGLTCEMMDVLLRLEETSNCEELTSGFSVDMESFCGCPGAVAPDECPFCPDGLVVRNPYQLVQGGQGLTCSDFESYAPFLTDNEICIAMGEIADECCVSPEEVESEGEEVAECSFCPNGQAVTEPEKIFVGTPLTCEQFQQTADNATDADCRLALDTFMGASFDPAIYCGCPDMDDSTTAVARDEFVCNLCPEGTEVVDPDRVVAELDTCAMFIDVAAATVREDFCLSVLEVGATYCCEAPDGKRQLRNKLVEEVKSATPKNSKVLKKVRAMIAEPILAAMDNMS